MPWVRRILAPLLLAAVVSAGLYWWVARDERSPDPPSENRRLYEALIGSDFAALARGAGLSLRDVHSPPPARGDDRETYLIYVTMGVRPVRQRIAYQVGTREGAPVAEGVACERDDLGWECFRTVGDVVVQGESYCVATGCETTRADARSLLDLGVRHLLDVSA